MSSSFDLPMRLLGRKRAKALRAVYGFCRKVDDIADGELPTDDKISQLEACRTRPDELAEVMDNYALPQVPFDALIDAMQMDVRGDMLWPSAADLEVYCDGAAGAPGLLARRIFGASDGSDAFALALGQILQRINILRDVLSDAQLGRVYLPRESWEEGPLPAPEAIAADPATVMPALKWLQADIDERLAALPVPPEPDRRALRPAYAMLGVYLQWFARLRRRHLQPIAGDRLPFYCCVMGTLKGLRLGGAAHQL